MFVHSEFLEQQSISTWSVNSGLVAWWKALPQRPGCFGGNWFDLVGGIQGTLNGTATATGFSSTKRPGGFGSWLGDGAGYVIGSDKGFPAGSSPWSIVAWFNPSVVGESSSIQRFIVGWGTAARTNERADLCVYNAGSGTKLCFAPYGDNPILADTTLSANVWAHGCVAYNGGTGFQFYLNGLPDSSLLTIPDAENVVLNSLQIGTPQDAIGGSNYTWKGNLDDIRIWNRVLSAAEVTALYQDDLAGNPLALNWQKRRTVLMAASKKSVVPWPLLFNSGMAA